jgi:hypothetical protein
MEFYEQLSIDRGAPVARVRAAYGQALAKLARRRKAAVERGGDPTQYDLQRAHLDEAWSVISDPLRRRRYDAMLRWTEGDHPTTEKALWEEVRSDLVHPAAAVAAKLLRVTTELQSIGQLPLAPSAADDEPPTLVPHDDDLTAPGRKAHPAHLGPGPAPTQPTEVTEVARPRLAVPRPGLATPAGVPEAPAPPPPVVAAPSIATPTTAPPALPDPMPAPAFVPEPPPGPSAEEIAALVDEHGFSGALLKTVRELQGQTLADLAARTRISERYLQALEEEAADTLPSATFVRGYVREVARSLHVDPDPLVARYMERLLG